jgi:TPR repeat protein
MLTVCRITIGSTVEVEVAPNADISPVLPSHLETTHSETVSTQSTTSVVAPTDSVIESTVAVASSTWQDFQLLRKEEEHFNADNSSHLLAALLSLCNEGRPVITAAIQSNHSMSQTDSFLNASTSIGEACYLLGELHVRGWDGQPFTDMQFPPLPYKPSALSSPLHFVWSKLGQPVIDALGTALWGALPHHVGAPLRDGVHYYLPPNTTQAVEYFKAAAELGNPDAHYVLGVMHAHGVFGFLQSEAKAVLHYYFAASGGNLDAHRALAHRHEQGIGVPQSCSAAVQYTEEVAKKAAADLEASHGLLQALPLQSLDYLDDEFIEDLEQRFRVDKQAESQVLAYYHNMADKGEVSAHVALGHLYLLGAQTATQDFLLASEHFHAAAEHGDPLSIANLGLMYAHGIGTSCSVYMSTCPAIYECPSLCRCGNGLSFSAGVPHRPRCG